jgi:hypothetical protein
VRLRWWPVVDRGPRAGNRAAPGAAFLPGREPINSEWSADDRCCALRTQVAHRAKSEKCRQRKSTPLLAHLVGASEHSARNNEAERLGGLEVDCHLEFRRPHDRQIGGFCALQNLVDMIGGVPEQVNVTQTVAERFD